MYSVCAEVQEVVPMVRMKTMIAVIDFQKGGVTVMPASLVILFAVSVTKVKCILRSKVLLQRQVKIYYWE